MCVHININSPYSNSSQINQRFRSPPPSPPKSFKNLHPLLFHRFSHSRQKNPKWNVLEIIFLDLQLLPHIWFYFSAWFLLNLSWISIPLMSKYWHCRVPYLSGSSRIFSRCFQWTFYPLLSEGWSNWNHVKMFETFAGAFDLAPNHDEIITFCSLIRRLLFLMSVRSGTIVTWRRWMPFIRYKWGSALHQSTHPWLDYHGAVLISYKCINMVCREIGRMGLTLEEELSAIEDGTQKRDIRSQQIKGNKDFR